ncbi:MAG: hypothetical protein OXF02_05150 [Simkaniaceae bacterium]|nr:hypothetical protein [Simkaniaceae bacterium]
MGIFDDPYRQWSLVGRELSSKEKKVLSAYVRLRGEEINKRKGSAKTWFLNGLRPVAYSRRRMVHGYLRWLLD